MILSILKEEFLLIKLHVTNLNVTNKYSVWRIYIYK